MRIQFESIIFLKLFTIRNLSCRRVFCLLVIVLVYYGEECVNLFTTIARFSKVNGNMLSHKHPVYILSFLPEFNCDG